LKKIVLSWIGQKIDEKSSLIDLKSFDLVLQNFFQENPEQAKIMDVKKLV